PSGNPPSGKKPLHSANVAPQAAATHVAHAVLEWSVTQGWLHWVTTHRVSSAQQAAHCCERPSRSWMQAMTAAALVAFMTPHIGTSMSMVAWWFVVAAMSGPSRQA